jgi:hypothetical protein
MIIPTAEDFFAEHCVEMDSTVAKQMIEFAKLHVVAALNQAANEADVTVIDVDMTDVIWGVDVNTILNAYPLTNIK